MQIINHRLRENKYILSRAHPKTVFISHHGNAILEAGGQSFKCISSSATAYKHFDLFNIWKDKHRYHRMLKNFLNLLGTLILNQFFSTMMLYTIVILRTFQMNSFYLLFSDAKYIFH